MDLELEGLLVMEFGFRDVGADPSLVLDDCAISGLARKVARKSMRVEEKRNEKVKNKVDLIRFNICSIRL